MWEARNKLQQPDVILDPDIQTYIAKYLGHNGNTTEMISMLAENYNGRLHQIDAFNVILQKLGVGVQYSFESFITRKLIESFNPSIVDSIYETETTKEWIDKLVTSRFWASFIVELSRRFPSSRFVMEALNKLCVTSPWWVTYLPPRRVEHDSYSRVIAEKLREIQGCTSVNDEQVVDLFKIAATDDLTLVDFILRLDFTRDMAILHGLQDFLIDNEHMRNLFWACVLKLSDYNASDIQYIEYTGPASEYVIEKLHDMTHSNPFIADVAVRKLMGFALVEGNEGFAEGIIQKLMETAGETEADPKFVVRAAKYWRTWDIRVMNERSTILYALKLRFFAVSILPYLNKRVNSGGFYAGNILPPSAEGEFLIEIAYQHPDLLPSVFKVIETAVKTNKKIVGSALDNLLIDLYTIGMTLFKLGCSIEFVRLLGADTPREHNFSKRKKLMEIMRIVEPPYSCEFMHEMIIVLTKPAIRALFFPDKSNVETTASYKQPLEVLIKFCSQMNNDPGTETSEEDAQKYASLCAQARDKLLLVKGTTQRPLDTYF